MCESLQAFVFFLPDSSVLVFCLFVGVCMPAAHEVLQGDSHVEANALM